MSQVPTLWTTDFGTTSTGWTALEQFLTFKHKDLSKSDSPLTNRSLLLKKVILQDSDIDCDKCAKQGVARHCPTKRPINKQKFLFWQLYRLSHIGVELQTLVITFDEEEPGLNDMLAYESGRIIQYCVPTAQRSRWVAKYKDDSMVTNSRWKTGSIESSKLPGIRVANVLVRGTDVFAEGRMEFEQHQRCESPSKCVSSVCSNGSSEEGEEDKFLPLVCVPTNLVAKAVVKYLENSLKVGYWQTMPRISFTGSFSQRRLQKTDGTWVTEEEICIYRKRVVNHMAKVVRLARMLETYGRARR